MRILHVDTEKGWRGGEQQLFYLVKGLKERGVEVAVACRVGDELEKRCREEGITVYPLKGNQTGDILRVGALGKNYDIIHATLPKPTQLLPSQRNSTRNLLSTRGELTIYQKRTL